MKKKVAVAGLLILTFGGIVTLFWRQELVYQLPTPVPQDYTPVTIGTYLQLSTEVHRKGSKPVLLHFFNPQCPCSRFNLKQFLILVRTHQTEIDFIAVVPEKENLQEIRQLLNDQVIVIHDMRQQLSKQCGVYSSPQAVLLRADGQLYYKGNYNKARYCTQKKTSYAALAIEQLLAHQSAPVFDTLATRAYGCQLPERN